VNHDTPTLADLDDWQLENSDQDLRGRPLMTRSGERLGIVRRMLVDCDRERVAALVLDNGQTVAIEDVEIRDDGTAYVDEARALEGASMPPARSEGEEVIPIVEEQMAVGKRAVERGRIQVRSRVVETPVHEEVRLREEHVDVERRPVNQRVDNPEGLFREGTIEVTETSEEAVVGKSARVTEELVIKKDVDERVERIDDTVRKTRVDVDRMDGDQDRR